MSYTAMVVLAAVIVLIPARVDYHCGAGSGRCVAQRQRASAAVVQRPGSVGALGQPAWLNSIAGLIPGTLLVSGTLMATTLFPTLTSSPSPTWPLPW